MPYKPTGNPPGRPRKTEPVKPVEPAEPAKVMTRAHKAFRRMSEGVTDNLHRPPRFKRDVGQRRPILHPNVIAKA